MLDAVSQGGHPRLSAGVGPLIELDISFRPGIWRLGPAWALLAGALASGAPLLAGAMPLSLVGAAILADSAWGVLWRLTAASGANDLIPAVGPVRVPYFRWGSPAGRAVGLAGNAVAGAKWHELTAAIALSAVLCMLLGFTSWLVTIVAWVVVLWAWILARAGKQPSACDALLNIGLPWLLGLTLAQAGASPADPGLLLPGILVGAAFTVLQWGIQRAYLSGGRRMFGAWCGQFVVLVALVGLQQPWATAVVAGLLLPPAWWLRRAVHALEGVQAALLRSGPWWLAALLLAALVVR